MRLASIREGDIVRIAGSLAWVIAKASGRLRIRWVGLATGSRWAKATEVEGHWAKR